MFPCSRIPSSSGAGSRGGDGGTIREVMKHPQVERAALVEIDQMVVEKAEHFPDVACELTNPRTRILFEDGARFVAETEEEVRYYLADSPDPVGPGEVLFQKKFHQDIYDRLNEDGIFVAQSESPWWHQRTLRRMYENISSIFPIVRLYWAYIPTYPSGSWSFILGSKIRSAQDFKADQYASLTSKPIITMKVSTRQPLPCLISSSRRYSIGRAG